MYTDAREIQGQTPGRTVAPLAYRFGQEFDGISRARFGTCPPDELGIGKACFGCTGGSSSVNASTFSEERHVMAGQRISLDFSGLDSVYWSVGEDRAKAHIDNLSTAAWDGANLWTASDETGTVERLSRIGASFGDAKSYPLSDYFSDLPAGKEYDIEALAFDAAREALWLCSSHARTRKKTERNNPADLLFDTDFELKQRRCVLGLLPLGTGAPRKRGARMLPRGGRKGSLRATLAAIGGALEAALDVPAKENGLDVEGLAIRDGRLFIGLRGPVVAGHGVVLSAQMNAGEDLALTRPPNVFLLPLNGLGVRDL